MGDIQAIKECLDEESLNYRPSPRFGAAGYNSVANSTRNYDTTRVY